MNPYEVLGVPKNATKRTIRSRYKEIALANHPDKLHGLSPTEKAEKEEYFKNVTVAYRILISHEGPSHDENIDYWRDIWNKVAAQNVWDTFVDVATKYIKRKVHNVTLPVTLEEVWNKVGKKVQFFLKDVKEPVKTIIDCGKYPFAEFEYEAADGSYHNVRVTMKYKEHQLYMIDDDGSLSAFVYIGLNDHVHGTVLQLPFLDGTTITITIPAFHDVTEDIVIPEYKLRVQVGINGIEKRKWDAISARDRCLFEEITGKIS